MNPPIISSWSDTHLSMMPFIRMALFQSFKVDFPARCTNSFGLITCSSYYKETQKYRTFSAWHRSGETVAQPILPSSSSLHQDFTGRNSMALPGTGLSTEHFDTACHENMPSGQWPGWRPALYLIFSMLQPPQKCTVSQMRGQTTAENAGSVLSHQEQQVPYTLFLKWYDLLSHQ